MQAYTAFEKGMNGEQTSHKLVKYTRKCTFMSNCWLEGIGVKHCLYPRRQHAFHAWLWCPVCSTNCCMGCQSSIPLGTSAFWNILAPILKVSRHSWVQRKRCCDASGQQTSGPPRLWRWSDRFSTICNLYLASRWRPKKPEWPLNSIEHCLYVGFS